MVVVGAGAGWRHATKGFVDTRLVGYMAPGAVLGSILGKQLLHWLTSCGMMTFAGKQIPVATLTLGAIFTILLLVVAWRLWRESGQEQNGAAAPLCWVHGPWCVSLPTSRVKNVSLLSLLGAGLLIGVMSGLLGIGGGVVLALIIGATPMVQLGVWNSHRLPAAKLQRAFALLVLAVAFISLGHLLWH